MNSASVQEADSDKLAKHSRSLLRRFLFILLLCVFLAIFMEICCFILYWVVNGEFFSYSKLKNEQAAYALGSNEVYEGLEEYLFERQPTKINQAIHPYLGFVLNPPKNVEEFVKLHRHAVNPYGFMDSNDSIQKRSEDKVLIGVVGGSVAYWFSAQGDDVLAMHLKKNPRFQDRQIRFIRLARGGYKQPQQLMTLNYIMALGGELDILINIDGFNEVALPGYENLERNVYPFFPRGWGFMVETLPDTMIQIYMGQIMIIKNLRKAWAKKFINWGTPYSIALQFIWKAGDDYLAYSLSAATMALKEHRPNRSSFVVTGPGLSSFTEDNLYTRLAALWMRCSVQLHRLCEGSGIRYFHFLQPNQYVDGSKPMGEDERRIAIKESHPYRKGVQKGYPELQALSGRLRAEGVDFHDMTLVFSDVETPLYYDNACHFNEEGNEILAAEIASIILESYD